MCDNARLLTSMVVGTPVLANGIIPLGSAIHGYGRSIRLNGNEIDLCDRGYYDISFSASVTPEATGSLTIQLYANGTPIAGALMTTTGTEDVPVSISFPWLYRKASMWDRSRLTYQITGASTVNNVIVEVEKVM